MRNSHIPQCPVVIFCQRSNGLPDLLPATPACPSACGGSPNHGQPTRLDKSVTVDLARRRRGAAARGWYPAYRCSSIDSVFTPKHRYPGAGGRRNERNGIPLFVPGGSLALLSLNLAGDCRYRSRRNPVHRSTVEGKPFEEKPKYRPPDGVGRARCGPRLGDHRGRCPWSVPIVRGGCPACRVAQRERPVPGYCDA
jgi:hypothetical protein